MEKLRIEWHKTFDEPGDGYLELITDVFFPCTVEKAKKVFHLAKRWCSDETLLELADYFKTKIFEIDELILEIKRKYPNTRVGSKEKKQCETDFKSLINRQKKYQRNLNILQDYIERK